MQDVGDEQQVAGQRWLVARRCACDAGFERGGGLVSGRNKHGDAHADGPFGPAELVEIECRLGLRSGQVRQLIDDAAERRTCLRRRVVR